jgi:hypothetical protein
VDDTFVVNIVEQDLAVITVWPGGPVSVGEGKSSAAVREFVQSVAATDWVINHTLGRRPIVSVTDLAGNSLLLEIQITTTQVIVRSTTPITGIAYLS